MITCSDHINGCSSRLVHAFSPALDVPPDDSLGDRPRSPRTPHRWGRTFCVRLGMYVSPRVKILGGVGVQRPTHPRAGTRVRCTGWRCGARSEGRNKARRK